MRCPKSLAAVFLLFLTVPSAAPADEPASVPTVLYAGAGDPYPVWVSAAEVSGVGGALRTELLSTSAITSLEIAARRDRRLGPPGGKAFEEAAEALRSGERIPLEACASWSSVPEGFGPGAEPVDPLSVLVAGSERILTGTITGIDQGFLEHRRLLGIRPSTLLEIEVDSAILGAVPTGNNTLYLLYHDARFQIGDIAYCSRNLEAYQGFYPAVGQRILFFQWYEAADEAKSLFLPHPGQIVFAETDGGLVSAPYLGGLVAPGDPIDGLVKASGRRQSSDE